MKRGWCCPRPRHDDDDDDVRARRQARLVQAQTQRTHAREPTAGDPVVEGVPGPEVQHEGAEGQRLRGGPVDALAGDDALQPPREELLQVGVDVEAAVRQLVPDRLVSVVVIGDVNEDGGFWRWRWGVSGGCCCCCCCCCRCC